jgi:DNA-binding MarR family transcriptional regulator
MADLGLSSSGSTFVTAGAEPANGDGLIAMLFAELTAAANDLKKHEARLHRADGLPPGELGILELLADGARTVPDLARRRGTSRQNVQIMVNRLKGQRWVDAIPNPSHKRCPLIAITGQGRSVLEAATLRKQQERTLWQGGFPEANATVALETVKQLRSLLRGGAKEIEKPAATMVKAKQPSATHSSPAREETPATFLDNGFDADEGLPVNLL